MKVVYQDKVNECSLCVMTMVHNHFYPEKKVSKNDLVKEFSYGENGMPLDVFETSLGILGISSATYKIPYEEFKKAPNDTYFVFCLWMYENYHFVVGLKQEHQIILYDPVKGKSAISYDNFHKIYSEIVVTLKKDEKLYSFKKQIENTKKNIFAYRFDEKFFISYICLEIILLLSSVFASFYIKIVLENVFPSRDSSNLIFVCLFFFLLYLFNSFFRHLISLYKVKKINICWKDHFYNFQKELSKKDLKFFSQNTDSDILEILEWMKLDVQKKYLMIPELIFETTTFLVLSILIVNISPYFLIIVLVNTLFFGGLAYLKFVWNRKHYQKLNKQSCEIVLSLKKIIDFSKNEKNLVAQKNMVSRNVKQNLSLTTLSDKNINFQSTISNASDFFNNFVFLIISFLVILLLFDGNDDLEISSIFLGFSLLSLMNQSSNELFGWAAKKSILSKSTNVLKQFNDNQNLEEKSKKGSLLFRMNNSIKREIKFNKVSFGYDSEKMLLKDFNCKIVNDSIITARNGFGKTTLLRLLLRDFELNKGQIEINQFDISSFDYRTYIENFLFLSSNSSLDFFDQNDLFKGDSLMNQKVISFLKEAEINFSFLSDHKKLSAGQRQIILFLHLLNCRNKIILLDEVLSNVNEKLIKLLFDNFKDEIWDNNFVIFVSHNKKLKYFFQNHLELKNEHN